MNAEETQRFKRLGSLNVRLKRLPADDLQTLEVLVAMEGLKYTSLISAHSIFVMYVLLNSAGEFTNELGRFFFFTFGAEMPVFYCPLINRPINGVVGKYSAQFVFCYPFFC